MKTYKFKLPNGTIETIKQISAMRAAVELKRKHGQRSARMSDILTITK